MEHFDRIVIGIGGIGSAVLYELARRGVRTLGIEQFQIAHDRGSSHGQSRLIRQAYFEHPDYVPLLRRADELWCEFERQTGERLFDRVGLLEIGPRDGILLPGIWRSVAEHGMPIERLSNEELRSRFPSFVLPEGMEAVFEPTAGLLHVERCVSTYVRRARELGATLLCGAAVQLVERSPGRPVVVSTPSTQFAADAIILCAGAWSPGLLLEDLPLRVVRKHLHWFATTAAEMDVAQNCPTFFYELPEGLFYGFPQVDARGVKLAEHSGGEAVVDPSRVDRSLDERDAERIDRFRRQCLPQVSATRQGHAVCMYTRTPDEHFIIDRHRRMDRAVMAAGLSGHGFKFAPVLGEILADLSLAGTTDWPINFLRADRWDR